MAGGVGSERGGEGDGVVFTRHGCSHGGAVPLLLLLLSCPGTRFFDVAYRWPNRAHPIDVHDRKKARARRSIRYAEFFLSLFLFPFPSLPIAS